MAENVLLVFEKPWSSPKADSRSASVLPFLEGLSRKLHFDLFYSTFFDATGFNQALKNLTVTGSARQIVYIGMHGHYNEDAVNEIRQIMESIVEFGAQIEGIILGSCFFGANDDVLRLPLSQQNPRTTRYGANWIIGYQHAMDWIGSTLIDVVLLESAMSSDPLLSKESIIDTFGNSLGFFNVNYCIGQDMDAVNARRNDYNMPIRKSIRLYFRGMGGTEPNDITEPLLQKINQNTD